MKKSTLQHIFIAGFISIMVIVMFSCTSQKQINKNKSSFDTSIVDKSKTKTEVEDKSTIETVTTRSLDTTVSPPKDSLSGSVDLGDDTTEHRFKSGTMEVIIKKNPKTKRTDFKALSTPKPINIHVNEKIYEKRSNDVKTAIEKDNNLKQKSNKSEATKDLHKETSFDLPWWLWLVLLGIALFLWWYYKK